MKTALDPRHQHRIATMQKLFSYSFDASCGTKDIAELLAHTEEIDAVIQKAAPEWPLSKISKVDLAILRLAVWELQFNAKEPAKVIIDEAVELAKSYGNEHSAKFINGALGSVMKQERNSTI